MPTFDLESALSEARHDKSFIDDAITDARYDLLSPSQRQGLERKVKSINPSNIDQTDLDHLVRDQVSKQVRARPTETREQGIQRRTLSYKNAGMSDANAGINATFDQNLADKFAERTGGLTGYEVDPTYGRRMIDEANEAGRDRAESEQSGFWGDTAKELGIGAATMNADVYGLAGHIPGIGKPIQGGMDWLNRQATGMDTEDLYRLNIRRLSRQVSPEMRAAKEKHFWDSDRGTLGDAWTDWRTYYSGVVESVPSTALTMGPSAMMAKGVFKIAMEKSMARAAAAGIEATAAREIAAKAAAKAASRAAYITGAVGEGGLAGAQSERQVRDAILAMDPAALRESDAMKSLMSQGMSFSDARAALANDAGSRAFLLAGISTGVFGGAGDMMLSKAIRGELAGGLAGRMAKGFVSEGLLEEMPQSATQQMAQNYAMQQADPHQDIMEGVVNQAMQGAAVGSIMGAGMAALFGRRGQPAEQRPEQPAPDEAAARAKAQEPAAETQAPPMDAAATGLESGPTLDEINAARHAELAAKPAHERSPLEILWMRRYELRSKHNATASVDATGGDGRGGEPAGSGSPVPGREGAAPGSVAGSTEGGEPTPATVADTGTGDGAGLSPAEIIRSALPAESVHTETASHEAATSPLNDMPEPSQAQKEAGNYKKGHLTIAGLDISIENPEGSVRSGVSKDGTAWSNDITAAHYGYIRGTEGKDGDHVDVFLKPGTPRDYSGEVYVIDQKNDDGGFDEHKVMLGYGSEEEAREAYLANYDHGWDGIDGVTTMPMADFKDWIKNGDHKRPAAQQATPASQEESKAHAGLLHKIKANLEDMAGGDAGLPQPAQQDAAAQDMAQAPAVQPQKGASDETRQPRLQPQGRGTPPSGRQQSGPRQQGGTGRGDDGKPDVAEHRGQHRDGGNGELRHGVPESEGSPAAVGSGGRQWVHDVIVGLIRRKGIANQTGRRATLDKAVEAAKQYMAGQPVKSRVFELRAKEFDRANDPETAALLRQIVAGIQATESAARSTAARERAARPSDNMLVRIRQMGGIHMRYRSDVLSDTKGGPVGLFSKQGKGLDDLATELKAEGFLIDTDDVDGGVAHLTELVQAAVAGRPTYSMYSDKHITQVRAEQEEIDRLAEAATREIADDIIDEIEDIPFDEPGNMTPAQVAAILGIDEDEIIHGTQGQTENTPEGAAQAPGQAEPGAASRRQKAGGKGHGTPPDGAGGGDFSLVGQSPEEVKAAEQRRADLARTEEDLARKTEQRRQAESEPFMLTGSDREADQAASRGQGDLLAVNGYGAKNAVFTADAAAQARALLKKKLGQLNTGIDPEILQAGITLAGYHIEAGARKFSDYARAMINDLGDAVKPYLKSWYAAVTLDPRAAEFSGMDDLATVQAADLDKFGDQSKANERERIDAETLESVELLREFRGRWQYKTHADGTWKTANSKDDAITQATDAYLDTPPDARLTRVEMDKRADAELIATMEARYGNLALPALRDKYSEMGGEVADLQRAGAREMNGNGGRRTAAAVSNEAARGLGEERLRLGIYIKHREELQNEPDQRGGTDLERDRQDTGTQDALGEEGVRPERGRDGGPGEQGISSPAEPERAEDGGQRPAGHEAAAAGEEGDFGPFAEAPSTDASLAGSDLDQRSGDLGFDGPTIEPAGTEATDRVARGGIGLDAKRLLQAKAQNIKVVQGDRANIDQSLPFLMDGQRDDVAFAEARFSKPNGYGVLFTNGTGTGKTASGLGIVKRFERQGKVNIMIVVPSDKIASDWIAFGKHLNLDITLLADTNDAGQGIVITTYANFGANDALVRRQWDLVVADESHYLMQAKVGKDTLAIDKLRAITMHPRGEYSRYATLYRTEIYEERRLREQVSKNNKLANRDDTMDQMIDAIRRENEALYKRIDELSGFLAQKRAEVKDEVSATQGEARPRVTFLSATPFAYEKTVDYAEGYLFDYPQDGKVGHSNQDGFAIFMVQHFGYRIRNNKLTEPGPEVNRGLMQRQFNSWLKSEGVLSGRMLDVEHDYDRKFILAETAIGKDIDRAMQWLWDRAYDQNNPNKDGYSALSSALHEKFDHLTRRYLLEAIKAKEVIPTIRQHLNLNRKVVVFHDFKKGGGFNPFRFSRANEKADTDEGQRLAQAYNAALDAFNAEFASLIESPAWASASPIEALTTAFPDAMLFNGDVPAKKRRENVALFQDDDSGRNLIVGQSAAMKEGVSLHDTTGKYQRVLINLGLPTQPTTAIQQEGRIYRIGLASNAMFRYLNTGTNWERWAFAQTIAQRSSTAENLAMGEEARAMMDAFIQGFEESDTYPPGHDGEGTGGKARDRQANQALTEWDRAMTLYFAQHKRTRSDKSKEGVDYFATPEPLGLKMVEWADIRDGDKALEPSAGHGAIARWLPDNIARTLVEPSAELASRLKMVAGDARLLQERFEDLNTAANKFDAIVMNPPFGQGGKTAVEHVAKAAQHLNNGGRIVALIPTGPAADKRFEKWFYEEEQRPVKPLIDHPALGPIYKGDTVKTNASWMPEGRVVRRDAGGNIYLKSGPSETTVNPVAWTEVVSAGPRTESFRPAADLYLAADIKLPQVAFERAGTRVATRVVVIEKQTDKDAAGRIQQTNRDYSDAEDIKDFFANIENASIPPRATMTAGASKPAASTPAQTAQDVQGAMTGFKLAQTKHAIKGIDLFVATLDKKVEYDEYKRIEKIAKKHGGYYSNFSKNGAIPGFQFEKEGDRTAFLDEFRSDDGETKFSRSVRSGGMNQRDAQAIVDIFRASNKNAPPVYVMSGIEKAPDDLIDEVEAAGASHDVEAAFHKGAIYVFADHIDSPERLVHVLAHEGRHFAFRAMHGPGLDKVLMSIYQGNEKVRDAANQKKRDLGLSTISEATEEALADMPAEALQRLSGWSKLVAFLRLKLREFAAGLRAAGFNDLAQAVRNRLGTWTDAEVAAMVRNADRFVRSGRGRGGVSTGTAFSSENGTGFAAEVLNELALEDDLFRHKVSQERTLPGVMKDVYPGASFLGEDGNPEDWNEFGATRRFNFKNPLGQRFYVYEDDRGRAWIDVSKVSEGSGGDAIYAAMANYAYNTGKVFAPDPAGLSEAAAVRRTSHMLSAALRYGTTAHLEPSPEQIAGSQIKGRLPLKWSGSDVDKTMALIHTFLGTLHNQFPGLKNYRYDFATHLFVDQHGQPVDGDRFELARSTHAARASRAGPATMRRGILLQSLVSSRGGERSRILGEVLNRSGDLVRDGGLRGVFSRNGTTYDGGMTSDRGAGDNFTDQNPTQPGREFFDSVDEMQGLRSSFGRSIADDIREQYAEYVKRQSAEKPQENLFGEIIEPESLGPKEWLMSGRFNTGRVRFNANPGKFITQEDINTIADIIQLHRVVFSEPVGSYLIFQLLPDRLKTSDLGYEDTGSYGMEDQYLFGLVHDLLKKHPKHGAPVEDLTASYDSEREAKGKELGYEPISPKVISDRFVNDNPVRRLVNQSSNWLEYIKGNQEAIAWELGKMLDDVAQHNHEQTPEGKREKFRVIEGDKSNDQPQRQDGAETRFSRNVPRDPILASALSKAGLGAPKTLKERVQGALNNISATVRNNRQYLADAFRLGAMDQFYGIQLAERQTLGNLPTEQSAYVAARLSTGSSSVMRGLLLHGMPRWADNGQHLEKIPGSKGLLEVLTPVKDDLNEWLAWMVGNRAARLMEEGKEHNLTREEIAALQALGQGRVARFSKAAVEFGKFKRSVLDVAQEAGLIDGTTRPVWDRMDWIPFYRTLKEDVRGPFGKRGLAGQRSGIRSLKGGSAEINDPLENILMNFNHLIGASLKNNAMLRVVENLDGTGMMEKVGYDFRPELIPAGQIEQILQANGVPDDMIGALPKEVFEGINKMWSIKAPADKDVVRVMMGGKPAFFRVHDPLLLRSLTSFTPYTFPGMKMARGFKRVLTSSVTATPTFMMRNFMRDTMSTLIIGRDRASVTGALRGIVKSYREEGGFEQMLFAGASFAGGYIDAGHPEDAARAIRRSLRAKGMNAASVDEFMSTLIDTPAKFWEKYREIGESIENANREAIFEAAVKSGKGVTEAAYEAKDLMDFSLRGGWAAYQLLADTIPFFNARVQGLYRLARSDMKSMMLRAAVGLMIPSVLLALANAGDERYEELPDWDKDTYWHFWVGSHHFRIPKPFEIGVLFATFPERITSALLGDDSPRKLADRVTWNIAHQLNLLEWPQIVKPGIEIWANRNTFRDAPIETVADENKLPHLRYNARTSDTMKLLAGVMPETADAAGMSPKRMEHLVNGYLGSIGSFALSIADTAVRIAEGAPDKPSMRLDDYPLLGVVYRVDPTISSQFVEDIYDMAKEVNQIHASVEQMKKEGKGEEAVALVEKYEDKLMMRGVLEATTDRLGKINKAMDQITASRTLTKEEKRKQVDELIATRNDIAKQAAKVVQPAF